MGVGLSKNLVKPWTKQLFSAGAIFQLTQQINDLEAQENIRNLLKYES